MTRETVRLLISCPDAGGIIAAVAGFVADQGGNILDADQHTDPQRGEFFMRVEIEPGSLRLDRTTFADAWDPLARKYKMRWRVYWGDQTKRMAILVSKASHCLGDLLSRWKAGELPVEIAFVAGNHAEMQAEVEPYGIPFHDLRMDSDNKSSVEAKLTARLDDAGVDFIVLARYMQILSPGFVAKFSERIINIHHSFLPAFAGAKPYQRAFDRGVKIIGATSHYVTDELDEGPIIAQNTLSVDHRDAIDDLIRKGRDLERVVLATAVRLHVEDKILMSTNKTIVFD